jgi:hypothetical protein
VTDDGIELRLRGATFKSDLVELFGAVLGGAAKAAIALKTGGLSFALLPNAITTFFGGLKAIKRDETTEVKAWILISGALLFAIERVIAETSLRKEITQDALQDFSDQLATRISSQTYTVEPGFFSQPGNLKLLDDVAQELAGWFTRHDRSESAKSIRSRLERFFQSACIVPG